MRWLRVGWRPPNGWKPGSIPSTSQLATSTMALKKLAVPEDVAAQIVMLASDRLSGHQTGQVVTVAGGMEGRLVP